MAANEGDEMDMSKVKEDYIRKVLAAHSIEEVQALKRSDDPEDRDAGVYAETACAMIGIRDLNPEIADLVHIARVAVVWLGEGDRAGVALLKVALPRFRQHMARVVREQGDEHEGKTD